MTLPFVRFWVLAGYSYGMGHAVRARWLAEALSQRYGLKSVFHVNDFQPALNYLLTSGHTVETSVSAAKGTARPHLEIVDALDAPEDLMRVAATSGAPLVCFENRTITSQLATVTINPIVAGLQDLCWEEHGVPHFGGPGYLFLSPDITARHAKEPRTSPLVKRVIVSCGGTDPTNQTEHAVQLLEKAGFEGEISLIVGAGYQTNGVHPRSRSLNIQVHFAPSSLAEHLDQSDLAILSGGMTLYEAACLGLPALVLPQNEHQILTGERFQAQGCAHLLSGNDFQNDMSSVKRILGEQKIRTQMSRAGRALINGQAPKLFPILESLAFPRS